MNVTRRAVLGAMLAIGQMPAVALAHSLDSLQGQLFDKEKFFQIKNEPAPEFALQDAEGRPITLTGLRGKIVVLHFIYTSCPDVCPLHAERIAEIQKMINVTPMRERVEFITITTDPKRDTPEVLRGYGEAHGLDPFNWTFLTSGPGEPEDTTRKLAEQFGHQFTETDDGLQMHSLVTHVIDGQGVLRANFHGLEFQPTNLVLFVNGLTNANVPHREPEASSMWDRLWSFF